MNESIKVDTRRDPEDRLTPAAFIWRGESYTVRDWGRRWREAAREHMLVRTVGGEVFELAFDKHEGGWRLCRRLRSRPIGRV